MRILIAALAVAIAVSGCGAGEKQTAPSANPTATSGAVSPEEKARYQEDVNAVQRQVTKPRGATAEERRVGKEHGEDAVAIVLFAQVVRAQSDGMADVKAPEAFSRMHEDYVSGLSELAAGLERAAGLLDSSGPNAAKKEAEKALIGAGAGKVSTAQKEFAAVGIDLPGGDRR